MKAALLATALTIVAVCASSAAAVCGDANGDDVVTVTDGVQALRAAAELDNTCDDSCDVDASGGVTVTDGVNILREAAGLPSAQACPGFEDRVSGLVNRTRGIFGPISKVAAVGATSAGTPSPCDNPEGGFEQTSSGFLFNNCVFGEVSLTGELRAPGDGTLEFVNLQLATAGDVTTLNGTLTIGTSGAVSTFSGSLDGSSSVLGAFVVTFDDLAIDALGTPITGLMSFDVSDAAIPTVVEVRVTVTGTTQDQVLLRFDDQTTANYFYNTTTTGLTLVQPSPTPTNASTHPNGHERVARTATPTNALTLTPTPTATPTTTRTPTPTPTLTAVPLGSCGNPIILPPGETGCSEIAGTTVDGLNNNGGTCGGASAREKVFLWTPNFTGSTIVGLCSSGTNFDTVLYMRQGSCNGPEVAGGCNDDACSGGRSSISPTVQAGTTYFIFVDGSSVGQGDFKVYTGVCIG